MREVIEREKSDANLLNIAATLDSRMTDYRGPNLIKYIEPLLNQGSVLDVGCGNGYYMNILKRKGFDVHGIEPSEGMINKAKEIFGDVDIRRGWAEDMIKVFKDEKFDNVIIIDVLEHIDDDNLILKHMNKLLRKGGVLAIAVPAYPSLFCKRDEMYGHYRRYNKTDLKHKVEKAGFKIIQTRYWSALTLPLYALYSRLPIDMEKTYLEMRSKNGIANNMLGWWFRNIENKVNFGFGVNLLCLAKKI